MPKRVYNTEEMPRAFFNQLDSRTKTTRPRSFSDEVSLFEFHLPLSQPPKPSLIFVLHLCFFHKASSSRRLNKIHSLVYLVYLPPLFGFCIWKDKDEPFLYPQQPYSVEGRAKDFTSGMDGIPYFFSEAKLNFEGEGKVSLLGYCQITKVGFAFSLNKVIPSVDILLFLPRRACVLPLLVFFHPLHRSHCAPYYSHSTTSNQQPATTFTSLLKPTPMRFSWPSPSQGR